MKSYLSHFTIEHAKVRWASDVGVLAYSTNGVLLETLFGKSFNKKSVKS